MTGSGAVKSKDDGGIAPSGTQVRRRSRIAQEPSHTDATLSDAPREQRDQSTRTPSNSPISGALVIAILGSLCLAYLILLDTSGLGQKLYHFASSLHADGGTGNFAYYDETHVPNQGKLDIVLNPGNHVFRQPSVLDFEWTITAGYRRPDGVRKRVYLVNNEFPGPTIEMRSGDTLRILVKNNLNDGEDIAIHWHGLHMENANDMDGAVGFSQCPVTAGKHFNYTFQVSEQQHGTFWYHAHDQVQRADGLFGALIVHQPLIGDGVSAPVRQPEYDEEKLLLIGDWYHRPAKDVLDWYMRSGSFGNEPVPDSVIVNYGGAYNCSDAVRSRPVDCVQAHLDDLKGVEVNHEKRYRFRVVNTGTLAGFALHLPGADVLPFEVDGGHPVKSNGSVESVGILYPGERVDFVATWPRKFANTSSWFIVELDEENFRYPNPALSTMHRFPVSVDGGGEPIVTPENNIPSRVFSLANATSPTQPTELSTEVTANVTFVVYATTKKLARYSYVPYGFMNHTSWKPQEDPALPLISIPRSKWDDNQFIPHIKSPKNDPLWVDLVINNLDDGSHPFHLHGYDFWVLSIHSGSSYWGSYNPFDASKEPPGGPYNLLDPVKRDTVFVPSRGYAVVRFLASNEGIWMFHCHILWHQASGMAMGFQVGSTDEHGAAMMDLNLSNREQLMHSCG